jgi:Transcription initiation factor IID, 18kD subunit
MMFVSGEVAEPLSETTGLVEDIVRAQVVEMVRVDPCSRLTVDCPGYGASSTSVVKVDYSRRSDLPDSP